MKVSGFEQLKMVHYLFERYLVTRVNTLVKVQRIGLFRTEMFNLCKI